MKKLKYSSPFNSRDYFSENLLPSEVYAGRKTIRHQIPFTQHDDLELLLIRKGEGTLTVNASQFPLSRGKLFCFSPHHFHKLSLPKGHSLEVSECHVNSGVYFYITACPYYNKAGRVPPNPPLCANLDENSCLRAENLFDEIARESANKAITIGENQDCFFLLLKLFGMLEKYEITNPS